MKQLYFYSHGVRCAAWHLPAATDALTGVAGRPSVVLAHGFSGTRDTGLLSFAEPFAAAGIDVLVFDYRGFGDSEGEPRQDISVRRQRQDLHAALAAARNLPGVDRDRTAVWGSSYGGGHAVAVAAQDRGVAAVVAMNPAVDGRATLAELARHGGVGLLARLTGHGLRDVVRARTGRAPHTLPAVGQPGATAFVTAPGAVEFGAAAGPTWRNEICARAALEAGLNRPIRYAGRLACPILVQVGTNDTVAPPEAGRRAARKAGYLAHLCEYPIDHFQAFTEPWHPRVLADQVEFLGRVLGPARAGDAHLRAGVTSHRASHLVVKLPW
jgi:pimeloyl-ACP methyl ester carboxylesterase